MGHTYISYLRDDQELAESLVNLLRSVGIIVWYDRQEIQPGMNWKEAIEKAIDEASTYVVLFSKHSLNSAWIKLEVELAKQKGKKVIIVLTSDISKNDLPEWISDYHHVQYMEDGHYLPVLKEIQSLVWAGVNVPSNTDELPEKENLTNGNIFISYADKDDEFVEKLISFLEGKGYGYWDFKRSDRDYQAPFHIELEKAIDQASAMICVASPEWKESVWTAKEYLYAEHKDVKTPTIVLMYREIGATLLIADRTYIDFTKDEKQGFEKLERDLKRRGLI